MREEVNMYTEFVEEFDVNDTRSTSNKHIGQLKLLLADARCLCEYFKLKRPSTNVVMIVAGGFPGMHFKILARMFPNVLFDLYDPCFDDKTMEYLNMENIITHAELFTSDTCSVVQARYNNYDIVFCSDIRSSPTTDDPKFEETFEHNVLKDMRLQEKCLDILTPIVSMLKFRIPYNITGNFTYQHGTLIHGIYSPPLSGESRLIVLQKDVGTKRDYNVLQYCNALYYFNTIARPNGYDRINSTNVVNMCTKIAPDTTELIKQLKNK